MIAPETARRRTEASALARQHVTRIDQAIEAHADAGWPNPLHCKMPSVGQFEIAQALARMYARAGWKVEALETDRDGRSEIVFRLPPDPVPEDGDRPSKDR